MLKTKSQKTKNTKVLTQLDNGIYENVIVNSNKKQK